MEADDDCPDLSADEHEINDDYMVPGCCFTEYCLMPGFHFKHECHTAEMLEACQEMFGESTAID